MKRSRGGGFRVEAGRESLVSSTGAALLVQTAQVSGLTRGLSQQLAPWRATRSIHDPGKTVLDLAVAIALGGDCLADAALVRAQPDLFGGCRPSLQSQLQYQSEPHRCATAERGQ